MTAFAEMTALNQQILNEIVDLLAPLTENDQERRALLSSALIGCSVLRDIDYSGTTRNFIIQMVIDLDAYGEVSPGQPALLTLLETARERVGADRQQRIDALRRQLHPSANELRLAKERNDMSDQANKSSIIDDLSAFAKAFVRQYWLWVGLPPVVIDLVGAYVGFDLPPWFTDLARVWLLAGVFIAAFRAWREKEVEVLPTEHLTEEQTVKMPPASYVSTLSLIPTPPAFLVGRDSMRTAIHEELDKHGRVSLHGMGGMGKTALAATIAHERVKCDEKVLWMTVGQREDWSSVYDDIGRIFGNQAIAGLESAAKPTQVRVILERQDFDLIVLDDAWDGGATRGFEREALPASCALMITARERVGVGRPHDIARLNDEDGAALFRYHAGLAEDLDVSQVCDLLGGHPMALEVAGRMASINGLSPTALYEKLKGAGNRVQALRLSAEDREAVSVALQTSYDALSENEKVIFRTFGALWAPTATVELLSLIVEMDKQKTGDALAGLVRHSLARSETTGGDVYRYRVHDLGHDFTRALLRDDNFERVRMRALDACVVYTSRHAEQSRAAHDCLDAEKENLFAAFDWAADRKQWQIVNQLALNLWENSEFLRWRSYTYEATHLLELGEQAARVLGDYYAQATHLGHLGIAYRYLGRMEEAIGYLRRALEIMQETGNHRGEVVCLANLGNAYRRLGELDEAIHYHQQALIISRDIGDKCSEGDALGNLGWAYTDLGKTEEAVDYLQQALEIAKETKNRRNEGYHLGDLGSALIKLGNLECAEKVIHQAIDIHSEIGFWFGVGEWLHKLGDITMIRASGVSCDDAIIFVRRAITHYEESSAIRHEIKDSRATETEVALEAARARLAELTQDT